MTFCTFFFGETWSYRKSYIFCRLWYESRAKLKLRNVGRDNQTSALTSSEVAKVALFPPSTCFSIRFWELWTFRFQILGDILFLHFKSFKRAREKKSKFSRIIISSFRKYFRSLKLSIFRNFLFRRDFSMFHQTNFKSLPCRDEDDDSMLENRKNPFDLLIWLKNFPSFFNWNFLSIQTTTLNLFETKTTHKEENSQKIINNQSHKTFPEHRKDQVWKFETKNKKALSKKSNGNEENGNHSKKNDFEEAKLS